jgi:hypothetical protein
LVSKDQGSDAVKMFKGVESWGVPLGKDMLDGSAEAIPDFLIIE